MSMPGGEENESLIELYNLNDQALILKTTSNKLYSISAADNSDKLLVLSSYNTTTNHWDKLAETGDLGIETTWDTPLISFGNHSNFYIRKKILGENNTNALIAELEKIKDTALKKCAHILDKEHLEKAIKVIDKKISSINKLLEPKQKSNPPDLNINPAEGKKIFFTSDIEGRLDLYLLFLIRIGALDSNKLNPQQQNVLNKCMQLKHVFMLNREETNTLISIAKNLNLYLNDNFQGKILFNGDFISNRPTFAEKQEQKNPVERMAADLWSDKERSRRSRVLAEACYEMFKNLKNKYSEDRLILVAGNHDVAEFGNLDGGLQDIKRKILTEFNIKRYYKLKTNNNKIVIFKHAPWATQQQFDEMLRNENQNASKALQNDADMPINDDFCFYNCDFHDNEDRNVSYRMDCLLRNCKLIPNNAINTNSLYQNNCFLIHGHTHEATSDIRNKDQQENCYINQNLAQKEHRICTDYDVHVSDQNGRYPSIDYFELDENSGDLQAIDLIDENKKHFTYNISTNKLTYNNNHKEVIIPNTWDNLPKYTKSLENKCINAGLDLNKNKFNLEKYKQIMPEEKPLHAMSNDEKLEKLKSLQDKDLTEKIIKLELYNSINNTSDVFNKNNNICSSQEIFDITAPFSAGYKKTIEFDLLEIVDEKIQDINAQLKILNNEQEESQIPPEQNIISKKLQPDNTNVGNNNTNNFQTNDTSRYSTTNPLKKDINPPINLAKGKRIFFTSDIEGRYDLYLRFLIDIGALDKNKLSQKERNLLVETNKSPLFMTDEELNTLLNIDVASCLSENFHDKILFNGDFVSGRPMCANYEGQKAIKECNDAPGDDHVKQRCAEIDKKKGPQYRTKMSVKLAEKCYDLFKALQDRFHEDCILVAGNHDIYNYAPYFDLQLKDVKNKILHNLQVRRYYHIKTEDGGHIIFKHAPWANDKQLDEMLADENQFLPNANIVEGIYEHPIKRNKPDVFGESDDPKYISREVNFYTYMSPVTEDAELRPEENKTDMALEETNMRKKRCFVIHGHTHGRGGTKIHDLMFCCDNDVHKTTLSRPQKYFTIDEFGDYTLKNNTETYIEKIGEKIDENKYDNFFKKTDLKSFAIVLTDVENAIFRVHNDRIPLNVAIKLLKLYERYKEIFEQQIKNHENQQCSALVNLLHDGPLSSLGTNEIASAICSLFIFSDDKDIVDFTYDLVKCFNKEKTEELFNKNDNYNYEKREEILLMALIINEYYKINKHNKISKKVEQIINNIKNFEQEDPEQRTKELRSYIDNHLKEMSGQLINEMVKIQQQLISNNYQKQPYAELQKNNHFNQSNEYLENKLNEEKKKKDEEKRKKKDALIAKLQEIRQRLNKQRQERKKRLAIIKRRMRMKKLKENKMEPKKNMPLANNENKIKKKTNELDPDIKKEEEKTEKLQLICNYVNNYFENYINNLKKLNEHSRKMKKENKFIPFYNQRNKNIIQNNNERNNQGEIESSLAYTLQKAKNMLNK